MEPLEAFKNNRRIYFSGIVCDLFFVQTVYKRDRDMGEEGGGRGARHADHHARASTGINGHHTPDIHRFTYIL